MLTRAFFRECTLVRNIFLNNIPSFHLAEDSFLDNLNLQNLFLESNDIQDFVPDAPWWSRVRTLSLANSTAVAKVLPALIAAMPKIDTLYVVGLLIVRHIRLLPLFLQ